MFYDFCLRRHDRYTSVFPPESHGGRLDERDISEPEEPKQYLAYIHHEGRHSIRTILLEHLDELAYKPTEDRYPEENRIPHFFNEILNIFGEHESE